MSETMNCPRCGDRIFGKRDCGGCGWKQPALPAAQAIEGLVDAYRDRLCAYLRSDESMSNLGKPEAAEQVRRLGRSRALLLGERYAELQKSADASHLAASNNAQRANEAEAQLSALTASHAAAMEQERERALRWAVSHLRVESVRQMPYGVSAWVRENDDEYVARGLAALRGKGEGE